MLDDYPIACFTCRRLATCSQAKTDYGGIMTHLCESYYPEPVEVFRANSDIIALLGTDNIIKSLLKTKKRKVKEMATDAIKAAIEAGSKQAIDEAVQGLDMPKLMVAAVKHSNYTYAQVAPRLSKLSNDERKQVLIDMLYEAAGNVPEGTPAPDSEEEAPKPKTRAKAKPKAKRGRPKKVNVETAGEEDSGTVIKRVDRLGTEVDRTNALLRDQAKKITLLEQQLGETREDLGTALGMLKDMHQMFINAG